MTAGEPSAALPPGPIPITDVDPLIGHPGSLSVVVTDVSGALTANCASATAARVLPDGRLVAICHGPHPVEVDAIVRWIDAGAPDPAPVRQGFTVAVVDVARREVRAATGARGEVALYYASTARGLIVSSHPRGVVERLPGPPDLRAERRVIYHDRFASPFVGVDRLPPGHVLRWSSGATTVSRWFRPEDVEPMGRSVDLASTLRDVVRSAVAASLPAGADTDAVAAMLSGGLDSTMVATTARRLLGTGSHLPCATHVPREGTREDRAGWEASDEPYARAVERATPGLEVTAIRNDSGVISVDLVPWYAERTFRPIHNPENLVWLRQISSWADDLGARVLLTGSSGNFWFSRGGAAGRGPAIVRAMRARRALRARADQHAGPFMSRRDGTRFAHLPTTTGVSASDGWLGRQSGTASYWHSDPLGDPEVIRFAHAVPASAWAPGGVPRGLAREAARGLLPDPVRLRRSRGGQAADAAPLIRANVARYYDALDLVDGSVSARRLIDVDAIRASLDAGLPVDDAGLRRWCAYEGRWITLGLFAAWWDARRRAD